jgi:hypothetical protein
MSGGLAVLAYNNDGSLSIFPRQWGRAALYAKGFPLSRIVFTATTAMELSRM